MSLSRGFGKGRQSVEGRERTGCLLDCSDAAERQAAQLLKNLDLTSLGALLGAENPSFDFLEFRRDESFAPTVVCLRT